MNGPQWDNASHHRRERLVAEAISANVYTDIYFWENPRYHVTDFHTMRRMGGGFENYVGDLEVKWYNKPKEAPAIFNYNKLQRLLLLPTAGELTHQIAIRFTNDVQMIPVNSLRHCEPYLFTRSDTKERDLVIDIPKDVGDFLGLVVNE